MKKTLKYLSVILAAAFLISCSDTLTDIQTKSFIKFYGSYQVDIGKDVHVLPNGGYAVIGCMVPDTFEYTRMVLLTVDEYGNQDINSPKYYEEDYSTLGESMIVLDDGYLLGGQIIDTLPDGSAQSDIYLVRANTLGDTIWTARYGDSGNESLSHMIKRTDGGYVLAGKKEFDDQDDIWIIMVDDTEGKVLYELSGNNVTYDDEANYIHSTGSGYLVACTYNDGASSGTTDLLSLYIDEYCNVINSRSIGSEYEDLARCILPFNGSYLMMGYAKNTSTGFNEIHLYTFSVQGNSINNQVHFATFSEEDADIPLGTDLIGERCVVTSKNELAIIGTKEVNENKDMLLLLVDTEGDLVGEDEDNRTIAFGDEGAQSGSSIRQSLEGGLIITGSNSLEGNSVISLVKTNARGEF